MSARTLRINELVKREIADILRVRYQQEAVRITISDVDIAPDLRQGRVYYSIIGSEGDAFLAAQFFKDNAREIKHQLTQRIVLKYTPNLTYHRDESLARGDFINRLIDDLELPEQAPLSDAYETGDYDDEPDGDDCEDGDGDEGEDLYDNDAADSR